MHIAIDARMYGTAQRGIGRYLVKLITHLEQIDLKNKYAIFLRHANFDEYQPTNPNFKKALWDIPWYGLREQLTISYLLRTNADLVHFPHWNVPLLFRQPFVVTIHDLELFSSNRTRENSTRGRFMYWFKFQAFKLIFRHAVLASRAIIVPSNFVREQLLDWYPQVRKKVKVIYEAPTIVYSSQSTVHSQLKQTVNCEPMTDHFVLYVGAAYPHKNLERLLEAWQIIHREMPSYKLVLVGREDFFWKKLKSTSYVLCPTSSIVFYGSASDEELTSLYKNAALLVQPSLEEGFSLSPLEALSFGCACAVSDIPVHREIHGNAVRYFDPLSISAIVETVKKALTIPYQAPLPREYSWRSHAQETHLIYEMTKKV